MKYLETVNSLLCKIFKTTLVDTEYILKEPKMSFIRFQILYYLYFDQQKIMKFEF